MASLRFALHHAEQRKLDRIIYVIPFTSIIDQNAKVVRDILEPEDFSQDQGKVLRRHVGLPVVLPGRANQIGIFRFAQAAVVAAQSTEDLSRG